MCVATSVVSLESTATYTQAIEAMEPFFFRLGKNDLVDVQRLSKPIQFAYRPAVFVFPYQHAERFKASVDIVFDPLHCALRRISLEPVDDFTIL